MAMRPLEQLPIDPGEARLGHRVRGRHDAADQLRPDRVRACGTRRATPRRSTRCALARQAASGAAAASIPAGTVIVTAHARRDRHDRGRAVLACLPAVRPTACRTGAWSGDITYASVPTPDGGSVTAMQPSPESRARSGGSRRRSASCRACGGSSCSPASIAGADLAADRALARARHDPAAARHGGGGARGWRRATTPARVAHDAAATRSASSPTAFNRMSARAGGPGAVAPRPRRERLARAQDPDHGDPRAPGEPRSTASSSRTPRRCR